MDTRHPAAEGPVGGQAIVYVRPISVSELPDEIRRQAPDTTTLYSVHDASGQRLALVNGRELAFTLARQYDFVPVNVH
ncbi:DUF1150 family protein [Tropicimonas sp.]|uniref:DUF1150 family protein n=1 Tax=Tropicimonas sp. TaxID=2067044 RepID=UPI003A836CF9